MARIDSYPNYLTDVADAIRDTGGTEEPIPAYEFDNEIRDIHGIEYTAGDNIQISEDHVISATDTTYTAGSNINISEQNVISADVPNYVAGENINIANGIISATDTTYTAGDGINIDANNVISADVYQAGTNISIEDGAINNTLEGGYGISLDNNLINLADALKVTKLNSSSVSTTNIDITEYAKGLYYYATVDSDQFTFKFTFDGEHEKIYSYQKPLNNTFIILKSPEVTKNNESFLFFQTDGTTNGTKNGRYVYLLYRDDSEANGYGIREILNSDVTSTAAEFTAIPKTSVTPTAQSHLTNKKYVDQEITKVLNAIGSITEISYEIVQELPASGEVGVIYLVPTDDPDNRYTEYIWVTDRFEEIGTTGDIDLSGYATLQDLNTAVGSLEASKQDKLTAGANIQIAQDGTISATDTTYKAGANIGIAQDGTISAVNTTYTAGTGINIDANNVISGNVYTAGANVSISNQNVISANDTTYTAGTGINITGTVISSTVSIPRTLVVLGSSDTFDLTDLQSPAIYYLQLETGTLNLKYGSGTTSTTFSNSKSLVEISVPEEYKPTSSATTLRYFCNPLNTTTSTFGIFTRGTITLDTNLVTITKDKESEFISLSDAQTITGVKTFSALPQSSVAPTSGDDLTNKTYVDSLIGHAGLNVEMATSSSSSRISLNTLASAIYVFNDKNIYASYTVNVDTTDVTFETEDGILVMFGDYESSTSASPCGYYRGVDGIYVIYYQGSRKYNSIEEAQHLTAGTNISIVNDVISATDTTYTAGTNISISNQNVISANDTTYTAGRWVAIDTVNGNKIDLNNSMVTSTSPSYDIGSYYSPAILDSYKAGIHYQNNYNYSSDRSSLDIGKFYYVLNYGGSPSYITVTDSNENPLDWDTFVLELYYNIYDDWSIIPDYSIIGSITFSIFADKYRQTHSGQEPMLDKVTFDIIKLSNSASNPIYLDRRMTNADGETLIDALDLKQDALTAGTNISISGTTISATIEPATSAQIDALFTSS